ncbi:MAG: DUF3087 domain-containing protein [Marinobacterium sp.]|nr:DUF3087 domain-containing protein [Marinobacterium sp.]
MQLKEIDKDRYSKHFKQLFIGITVLMLVIALGSSQLLIALIGGEEGSNFLLNLIGVAIAGVVCGSLLRRYKEHPWMYELIYVWELKQQLNQIYRKQKAIRAAMEDGDPDAMTVMHFSYQGSKQLYELDNNTITMDELNRDIDALEALSARYQVTLSLDNYRPALLERF